MYGAFTGRPAHLETGDAKRTARSARLLDSTDVKVSVQHEGKRFDADVDPKVGKTLGFSIGLLSPS